MEDFFYPGTEVLRNKPRLCDAAELERFERGRTFSRVVPLRSGAVVIEGRFDLSHLQAIHGHVFQDVYGWAGRLRGLALFKGGWELCRPEYLTGFAADVFGRLASARSSARLAADVFAERAAEVLGDLNALHPFR